MTIVAVLLKRGSFEHSMGKRWMGLYLEEECTIEVLCVDKRHSCKQFFYEASYLATLLVDLPIYFDSHCSVLAMKMILTRVSLDCFWG